MLKNGTMPHLTAPKHEIPSPIATDDILVVFGTRVKDERQKQHMTVEQLAEYAGTSDDTIKRIENNRKSSNRNGKAIRKVVPGLDVAYNISHALGVPMQALLPMERADMISCIKSAQASLQLMLNELEEN